MIYSSTITSKGTITIPSAIRKQLGMVEGNKVAIELMGDTVAIKARAGWDEFVAVGSNVTKVIRPELLTKYSDPDLLKSATQKAKIDEYKNMSEPHA